MGGAAECSRTVCVTLSLCEASGPSGKQWISSPKSEKG